MDMKLIDELTGFERGFLVGQLEQAHSIVQGIHSSRCVYEHGTGGAKKLEAIVTDLRALADELKGDSA